MLSLAQGLANILGFGTVSYMEDEVMDENERGWSGAEVVRKRIFFTDGSSKTMIFKTADRKERCVMVRLTEQGHLYTPAAFAADVTSEESMWIAMEDFGKPGVSATEDEVWLRKVAEALCLIHVSNMGKQKELSWLPVADETYWKEVVTTLSVDHFERKIMQCPAFAAEFGKYLPMLREQGEKFIGDMTALCNEESCMTLTHGDLQMRDGAHVYNCDGMPGIIDFGFCRYAPFYIDLVGWFSSTDAKIYYDVLRGKGIRVSSREFEERVKTAFRYIGFLYLFPSMADWQEGPTKQKGQRLLQALHIILTGEFPERRRAYSRELFQRLIREHEKITDRKENESVDSRRIV